MSKPFTPKVVTANALLEGDVVYLTADDAWSRDLSDAEIIEDEAHAELRLLDGASKVNTVVGVYLADIALKDGVPQPTHFREEFRTRGPSNYNHGKQADLV
ncbi:DUF2849 domain-containing protein [Litoreibacter janthinus]|uniref:Sulfite reductase (NADPH) hemoprotein beta-component n=1 Tax=Litoreibacter janthinus TaxID=670154 RepID=A0A1I6GZQ8_9RHOB|nr:DUF2849 domain-containing protein [Litoreibacter janthinus]SFR47665.1 Protein of unknown function [Litoreibacter janthinus]